jgi:hypothetical protein
MSFILLARAACGYARLLVLIRKRLNIENWVAVK